MYSGKWIKLWVIVLLTFLISCAVTRQSLNKSFQLSPGMTKQQVQAIMGAPIKSDFEKNVEEWFYCSTGIGSDQHLALFFHDGGLVSKKNYNVSIADTRGVGGSCENFIKQGDYRVPNEVIEIRMRY